MLGYILERERTIPVMEHYDLAVVGAGMGGVAAALSAARRGKKVLLVDKMYALGGLATLGLITIYLPLCDGTGRQVSFGLNEELLRLAISHGWEDKYPDTWLGENKVPHGNQRFEVGYNAQVFALLLEQAVEKAGCTLLYGTSVVDVVKKNNVIQNLILENCNGRYAVEVDAVVDGTGDARICMLAGVKTKLYQKGNALAAWYYETEDGKTVRRMLGAADVLSTNAFAEAPQKLDGKRYAGIEASEISDLMVNAHQTILEHFLQHGEVSQSHSLATIATIPQLRMTRRLVGEYELDEQESHVYVADSIGLVSDWRKSGPVYEIPLRSLYSSAVVNLAAVGRCISVSDGMWDITRVIPPAVTTGEAAGVAFSLGSDLTALSVEEVQSALRDEGVVIHEKDLC